MLKPTTLLALTLAVLYLLTIGFPAGAAEQTDYDEMSTEDYLYIRGLVREVIPEAREVLVRPLKGKRITIQVSPETILDGIDRLDDLEKKQQIKVWYIPETEGNRAIKIERIIDLGC